MKKQDLIQTLSQGSHLVEFTKKDGTRHARVLTLDPKLVPAFEAKTDRITKQSETTVRAWEVKGEKWTSLIPENVISAN